MLNDASVASIPMLDVLDSAKLCKHFLLDVLNAASAASIIKQLKTR